MLTKLDLMERLRALADRELFEKGRFKEGVEAYLVLGADPPPRLFVSCGCALWREGRYFEAAEAFARAPLDLSRDHLRACREECLRNRQVENAVAVARMEGTCIREELLNHARHWQAQGHIADSLAAYRAAGVEPPRRELRNAGLYLQMTGAVGAALDAFEAAGARPPLARLEDWLGSRPPHGTDPGLKLRVLKALLSFAPE